MSVLTLDDPIEEWIALWREKINDALYKGAATTHTRTRAAYYHLAEMYRRDLINLYQEKAGKPLTR